ncbi:hypothetical protein V6Z11_D07G256600 [Gossypium hirsutum]
MQIWMMLMLKLHSLNCIPSYLLNKPTKKNNSNSRKSPTQAVIVPFIIIISSTERIKFKLEEGKCEVSKHA